MEMFNKMFSEYIPREERMHEITHKLKKYEKKVEGEPLNQKRLMKEWRQNQKRRYTDVVLSRLNMKGSQKEEAHYLIQKFNFKDLCRRCSMEQIITAICVYIKFKHTQKTPLCRFGICNENGLTESLYGAIVTNLAAQFQKKIPLSNGFFVN